jgi:hypothetical protein
MNDPLNTYLQDHLAGARFAIDLLKGLSAQTSNLAVARFAACLLEAVSADCQTLQDVVDRSGGEKHHLKEMAAWAAQKASRFKLDLTEPVGVFESIEMLTLGVQGKLALWNALRVIQLTDVRLQDLKIDELTARAIEQYVALEELRLQLAPAALQRTQQFASA